MNKKNQLKNNREQKVKKNDKLLTMTEVADKLRVTRFYVSRNWQNWIDYGIKPIRLNGNPSGHLLFRESEVEGMIEKWQTVN